MKFFVKSMAAPAFALAIGLNAGAAQAFTSTPLNFHGGITASFSNDTIGMNSFADYFSFSLPVYASGSGGSTDLGAGISFGSSFVPNVAFSNFSLYSVGGSGSLTLVPTTGGLSSSTWNGITYQDTQGTVYFSGLSQGTEYAFYIAGSGTQVSSSYSGTVTLSPVPEPRTYAMLLAGLGLVGFTAFRRKRSNTDFS